MLLFILEYKVTILKVIAKEDMPEWTGSIILVFIYSVLKDLLQRKGIFSVLDFFLCRFSEDDGHM